MGEILLIAEDWQFRALIRAQLLEEGFGVRALPSLDLAMAYLARDERQPRLVILDTQGGRIDARAVWDLWRLSGRPSLILCGGASSQTTLSEEDLPPVRVLHRPVRVEDLVEEVRRIRACPKDNAGVE